MAYVDRPSLAYVASVLALLACSSKKQEMPPALTVSATIGDGAVDGVTDGVKANGSNLVAIRVDGATKGPVRVSASRGTFPGGDRSVDLDLADPTVNLVVCDSRTATTCAGAVTISATDANF